MTGKVTAQTVQNARKAKVGARQDLQLTDTDRARQQAKADEQSARLARIAARNKK